MGARRFTAQTDHDRAEVIRLARGAAQAAASKASEYAAWVACDFEAYRRVKLLREEVLARAEASCDGAVGEWEKAKAAVEEIRAAMKKGASVLAPGQLELAEESLAWAVRSVTKAKETVHQMKDFGRYTPGRLA